MRFVSCHNGQLQHRAEVGLKTSATGTFRTGLDALDRLAPGEGFMRGAVHELLMDRAHGQAKFFAALLGRSACGMGGSPMSSEMIPGESPVPQPIIWCDPKQELYPPALVDMGIDLSHVYLLHPRSQADESWAIAECLRCRGVGAVIAAPQRLTRIEARRLQLAAETGGSVAILLRHMGPGASVYAAATRWLVAPHPGQPTVQRWKIQFLHGHGGRVGQCVYLECCRETHSVRATEELSDRPVQAPAASLTA